MYISPHKVLRTFNYLPNDSLYIDMINAKNIWKTGNCGEGNVVAILDTGIDTYHENLRENIIDGYNFTSEDQGNPSIYEDYNGHGTHVAGIIIGADKKGIVGVAPKSKALVLKVLNSQGNGDYETIIRALKYAVNWKGRNGERVTVINLSLGGNEHSEPLYKTIKEIRDSGIVIVAAAGNSGDGDSQTIEKTYPSYYHEVISIGAVNSDLEPSFFSVTNLNINFVAPGENILSTHLNNEYARLSGTSMAAPFVSGAVALILNMIEIEHSDLKQDRVRLYLRQHIKELNYPISQVGDGFIQLVNK